MADSGSGAAKAWAWIGGILATVLAGLAVWYLTSSNSPLHHSGPATTGASLQSVSINSYSPCCTFAVKADIQGYNGQHCTLYAILVNTTTGNTLGSPFNVGWYEAQAGNDEGTLTRYLSVQASPGTYDVRFTLYAPNGTQLDQRDSSTIVFH